MLTRVPSPRPVRATAANRLAGESRKPTVRWQRPPGANSNRHRAHILSPHRVRMEVRRKGYDWGTGHDRVATSTLDKQGLLMEVVRQVIDSYGASCNSNEPLSLRYTSMPVEAPCKEGLKLGHDTRNVGEV